MDQISMVFQKVYLFADTVENNIKFGCPNVTHEEVVAAAKKACCHDFILTLPKAMTPSSARVVQSFRRREAAHLHCSGYPEGCSIVILDEATANCGPGE